MSRLSANALLVLASMIWGSTFAVQKIAFLPSEGEAIGPLAFSGLRFVLGALVVAPLAWRESRGVVGLDRRSLMGFVLCGAALAIGAATQQIGLIGTSVTNAGFLTGIYIVLVPVFSLFLMRRRPHWMVWPAAGFCLGGIWLLNGGTLTAFSQGDVWVLFSTIFWGLHVTVVGIYSQRSQRPLTLAVMQFIVAGMINLCLAAGLEVLSWAAVERAAFALLYAGILSVGGAFTLQVIAQRYTHPAAAAIILSGEMVFAALAGALVLGERMTAMQGAGAALIVGGILAVELAPYLHGRIYTKGRSVPAVPKEAP